MREYETRFTSRPVWKNNLVWKCQIRSKYLLPSNIKKLFQIFHQLGCKEKDICPLTFQNFFESFINSVEEIFQAIHFFQTSRFVETFYCQTTRSANKAFFSFFSYFNPRVAQILFVCLLNKLNSVRNTELCFKFNLVSGFMLIFSLS